MRTFQEIKENYKFTELEAQTLKSLGPLVEPHADRIVSDFYNLFLQIPDTAGFLAEAQQERLRVLHRAWLLALFQGPYDDRYFQRLQRIGHAHVRIGLSAHFVYVGMNHIRLQLLRLIETEVEPKAQEAAAGALEKILDLNLDVIARTYHEEEVRRIFVSHRLDNALIRFAQRFTFGLDLLLVVGLIGLSLGVVAMIVSDVSQIFTGSPSHALVAAMGSLLVLWMVIELLEAEIDRLKGGAFKIHLFVGAAMVAFIRKILVATMAHETPEMLAIYLAGVFVLGSIYWLVSRAEARRG
ncbi:MAG: heme-binding sensor globin domain-containing protein [Deltaproteobacteria bacterium]|nr:heme-binding sensor globin domain-containing protein [Deltaproteobacteria bacterium]